MQDQVTGETFVEVLRCSVHGVVGVMFSKDPKVGSTRITPAKCCGIWDEHLAGWWVSSGDIAKDLADESKETP